MECLQKDNARTEQLPIAEQDHTAEHQHQCPDLPDAVLPAILQHVHLRHRLSACALVCKSWAAAVPLTIADVIALLPGPNRCKHLQDWLHLWGEQVSSIDLSFLREDGEQQANALQCSLLLPCSKFTRLTSLHLYRCPVEFHTPQDAGGPSTSSMQRSSTSQPLSEADKGSDDQDGSAAMQLSSAAASAGSPAALLPALRELDLSNSKIRQETFLQLSHLTGITSLRLHEVTLCAAAWVAVSEQQGSQAFTAVLQQLQGLGTLEVERTGLQYPAVALAPLSTMQRLQRLSLSTDACSTAALAHLPTSLTSLELLGYEEDYAGDFSYLSVSTSSLPRLPLLCAARLTLVNVQPGVLASWNRLTQLSIRNVLLEPAGGIHHHGDFWEIIQELRVGFVAELGKLTQLQDLSVYGMNLSSVPDTQLLTALTASSQLTQLVVLQHALSSDTVPLPRGALQQMFALPKQWPSLQTLRLDVSGPDDDIYGDEADWCVDASDISRLASCLPALGSLSLKHVVKDLDTVAALTQLMPSLTHLSVAGHEFDDYASGDVAQLTSLVELEWRRGEITPAGLQQLTALTKLGMLIVDECPHVEELKGLLQVPEEEALGFDTSREAEEAGRSDVWEQLQELCNYAAANPT